MQKKYKRYKKNKDTLKKIPPVLYSDERSSREYIYGIHAVRAALESKTRVIEKLLIQEKTNTSHYSTLITLAQAKNIPVQFDSKSYLDSISNAAVHQGIIALTAPLMTIAPEQLLEQLKTSEKALVLILDQIQDPQNLGSIIRSAEAFHVSALIIPANNSAPLTGATAKTAAGALDRITICKVPNLRYMMDALKQKGFWILGLSAHQGIPIQSLRLAPKTALVLGSEHKGIRHLLARECDELVSIPMAASLESLNVSVAAGIALYAISFGIFKE